MIKGTQRHIGKFIAAVKLARQTRNELAGRALTARAARRVGQCDRDIHMRMVSHFLQRDETFCRRVTKGLGIQIGERPSAETAGVF